MTGKTQTRDALVFCVSLSNQIEMQMIFINVIKVFTTITTRKEKKTEVSFHNRRRRIRFNGSTCQRTNDFPFGRYLNFPSDLQSWKSNVNQYHK